MPIPFSLCSRSIPRDVTLITRTYLIRNITSHIQFHFSNTQHLSATQHQHGRIKVLILQMRYGLPPIQLRPAQAQEGGTRGPQPDHNAAGILAAEGLLVPGYKVHTALTEATKHLDGEYNARYAGIYARKLREEVASVRESVRESSKEAAKELLDMKGLNLRHRDEYCNLHPSNKNDRWMDISSNISAIRRKVASEESFGDMAIEAMTTNDAEAT